METPSMPETSGSGSKQEYTAGIRVILLNLPEDEGEGLGFRLTRTLWDPYPWVREITPGGRADTAGLKRGDCLLQADGRDLLGLPIGQVAGLIRGDGSGCSVTLDVWNCGVDPEDDPELLWSCGGGLRGEKSRRALSGVVRALACSVCASTATKALNCARSHIYCESCWTRLDKCALCREPLPAKNSPYAKNLVAEQVFEAIAAEYELKTTVKTKRPSQSVSAYTSPNRSPNSSPSPNRRGQYQLSLMKNKRAVHFTEKFGQTYASDPNIHMSSRAPHLNSTNLVENRASNTRCCHNDFNSTNLEAKPTSANCRESNSNISVESTCGTHRSDNFTNLVEKASVHISQQSTNLSEQSDNKQTLSDMRPSNSNSTISVENQAGNSGTGETNLPKINVENTDNKCNNCNGCASNCQSLQHKLVTRLRHACSLADLQNAMVQCNYGSSNNLTANCKHGHHSSLDNIKTNCNPGCDSTVLLLPATPIYLINCDHNTRE